MNRRHFFKMLGTAVASAVCAPLAKLIPQREPRPRLTINGPVVYNIRKPQRFFYREQVALSAEDFTKRYVQPAFAKVLAEHEKDRALALEDLKHAIGGVWPS